MSGAFCCIAMATIKLKNSQVKDKAPQPTDLVPGELAVTAGAIVKIAGAGAIGGTPASETAKGIAELATQAETDAGTDDLRIVTPLKLATYVKQNLWIDGGSAVSNFGSAPARIDGGAAA
jgi:hypothetical protein